MHEDKHTCSSIPVSDHSWIDDVDDVDETHNNNNNNHETKQHHHQESKVEYKLHSENNIFQFYGEVSFASRFKWSFGSCQYLHTNR